MAPAPGLQSPSHRSLAPPSCPPLCAHALQRAQKASTFFDDEWRTPTYVGDLLAACRAAVERCGELPQAAAGRIFNVGGPDRINRVDMALALCRVGECRACV